MNLSRDHVLVAKKSFRYFLLLGRRASPSYILYLFRPSDLTRATPWAMKVKKYTLYGSSQNSAPFDFDICLEKAWKEAFKPYLQSQFWKKTLRVCLLNVSIDKVNLPV